MNIEVTSLVMAALERAAAKAHPQEACGILLGEGNCITAFQPTQNVYPAPETHFEIDPQALIDAHRKARSGGPQVLGYFHSHPKGPAAPSAKDAEMAAGDGAIWAIWGEGKVAFWRSTQTGFAELSYSTPAR